MASMTADAETMRERIARARRGEPGAATRLVRDHDAWVRSAIYAVTGRSELVDDLVQQIWTRVWERLDTLENPEQFRAWLYSVARNTALDGSMADKRRRTRFTPLDDQAAPLDRRQPGPLAAVARGELQATLVGAVQALPALYREPFVLRHLEDWNYAEIGQVLGLSVETVETRLVRARRMLREMLQGKVEP
jgi:RNA polymerase sigma factor (sigma-70 family)